VAVDTPMYQGRSVGVPLPSGATASPLHNVVTLPSYGSVVSTTASANVLSSCTAVVEGCMDSTAVNYDSKANTNTNSWCVPPVLGCMMPGPEEVTSPTHKYVVDGGSGNYSAAATVNHRPFCNIGRYGCTDATAINHDAFATIDDGSCYPTLPGCLDATALNFNCSQADVFTNCNYATRSRVPTVHDQTVCKFEITSPPPPSPAIAPGAATKEVYQMNFVGGGTVEDYDAAKILAMKEDVVRTLPTTLPATVDNVTITITPASVNVLVQIDPPTGSTANDVLTALAPFLVSPAATQAIFSTANVAVLSTPVTEVTTVVLPGPPPPPPDTPVGAIVGGVIGGIVALLICIGICYFLSKRGKQTYPA